MPTVALVDSPRRPVADADADYAFICRLVYERSRITLGPEKRELVHVRLGKRVRATGLADLGAYCGLLRSAGGAAELVHLVDAISTNHTYFFREGKHFDFLRTTILPATTPAGGGPLRLWSAASSSGEEPYSLAILLAEHAAAHPGWDWSLDASDISTRVLAQARQAVYPEVRLGDVPPDWQRRYFQRGVGACAGQYRVKESLRRKIRWHHVNLLQPRYPFGDGGVFDVIFCRNVMIYFDRPTQEQLVAKLADQLAPGGYLMIGHAESLGSIRHKLHTVQPAIYRKASR